MPEFSDRAWLAIPAIKQLAEADHWVCWGHPKRPPKEQKAPYQPGGIPASSTNPNTWSSFEACFQAVVDGKFAGIGRVLSRDDPIVGVDLDHVLKDGVLTPDATKIVEQLSSYTEISPSGTGLHIYCEADLGDFRGRKHGNLEIYATDRYLTVTANPWRDDLQIIQNVDCSLRILIEDKLGGIAAPLDLASLDFTIDPDAIADATKLMILTTNNAKFRHSWLHTRQDFGAENQSLSSYDLSLATYAVEADWTDQEVVNLLIMHRRNQGDVSKALRADYLARTLARARDYSERRIPQPQAADIARTDDARTQSEEDQLGELGTRLGLLITRVIQRGKAPAFYYLDSEHGEISLGRGEAVLSQARVRAAIMEVTQTFMQRVKPAVWDRLVTLLIQTAELEEIGEGQYAEELRGYIHAYLEDRPPGEPSDNREKADLFKHPRPILLAETVWIRVDHFHRWIATTMHDRIHKSILCTRMKEIGCESKVLGVRDPATQKVVNSRRWSIPEWKV